MNFVLRTASEFRATRLSLCTTDETHCSYCNCSREGSKPQGKHKAVTHTFTDLTRRKQRNGIARWRMGPSTSMLGALYCIFM